MREVLISASMGILVMPPGSATLVRNVHTGADITQPGGRASQE